MLEEQKNQVYVDHEKNFGIEGEEPRFWVSKYAEKLVPSLKSKICEIYRNNSSLNAALKSYAYQLVLREAYSGLFSSELNIHGCCDV